MNGRAAAVIVGLWLLIDTLLFVTSRGEPVLHPALPEAPAASGKQPSGQVAGSPGGVSFRPAVATLRPPATPSLQLVTRQGDLAWADESHGPGYLAIPIGPGYRVRVCGPAACVVMRSTDAGPNHERLEAGRIADVAVGTWERICGVPRRFGLCPGSWTVVGR